MNASSGFLSLLQVPPSLPLFLGFYDLLSANDVEQEEEEEARVALTKTQSLKHARTNNRTSLAPLFPFPPSLIVFSPVHGCVGVPLLRSATFSLYLFLWTSTRPPCPRLYILCLILALGFTLLSYSTFTHVYISIPIHRHVSVYCVRVPMYVPSCHGGAPLLRVRCRLKRLHCTEK